MAGPGGEEEKKKLRTGVLPQDPTTFCDPRVLPGVLPGDWRTPLIGDPGPCFADLLRLPGMI